MNVEECYRQQQEVADHYMHTIRPLVATKANCFGSQLQQFEFPRLTNTPSKADIKAWFGSLQLLHGYLAAALKVYCLLQIGHFATESCPRSYSTSRSAQTRTRTRIRIRAHAGAHGPTRGTRLEHPARGQAAARTERLDSQGQGPDPIDQPARTEHETTIRREAPL